jgi:hypothetical protein
MLTPSQKVALRLLAAVVLLAPGCKMRPKIDPATLPLAIDVTGPGRQLSDDDIEVCKNEETTRRLEPRHAKLTADLADAVVLRSTPARLESEDQWSALARKWGFYVVPLENEDFRGCFRNVYVDHRNGTIEDKMTGLLWQQAGSEDMIPVDEALDYLDRLNRERLGGYQDWRLPTYEEAATLVETSKRSRGNRIRVDEVFDHRQTLIWLRDRSPEGAHWGIYLKTGGALHGGNFERTAFVRAVRTHAKSQEGG